MGKNKYSTFGYQSANRHLEGNSLCGLLESFDNHLGPVMKVQTLLGSRRSTPGLCSLCSWRRSPRHPLSLSGQLHVKKVTRSKFPTLEHHRRRISPRIWLPNATTCCRLHGDKHRGRSQRSVAVHSATESTYFGSLKRCQPGFGNVGIAFVAVGPVVAAAVIAALAVFAAAVAAGCIPQCFAVGH